MFTIKVTRTSNVGQAKARMRKQTADILEQAAHEGARAAAWMSRPTIGFSVSQPQDKDGLITVRVSSNPRQFWGVMFDKGTLGKRKVPLTQPGRRRMQWKSHHRTSGKQFTAHRHAEALARGGIKPEYFIVRGKRKAEQRRDELLRDWIDKAPPTVPRGG
jgi:hypothetical protein